jgi:hypothetical protein
MSWGRSSSAMPLTTLIQRHASNRRTWRHTYAYPCRIRPARYLHSHKALRERHDGLGGGRREGGGLVLSAQAKGG